MTVALLRLRSCAQSMLHSVDGSFCCSLRIPAPRREKSTNSGQARNAFRIAPAHVAVALAPRPRCFEQFEFAACSTKVNESAERNGRNAGLHFCRNAGIREESLPSD